jgi:hypothetical protein
MRELELARARARGAERELEGGRRRAGGGRGNSDEGEGEDRGARQSHAGLHGCGVDAPVARRLAAPGRAAETLCDERGSCG